MSAAEQLKPLQKVISWSLFDHARDNAPDRHNGTWDDLVQLLTKVNKPPRRKDPGEAKKACPAFSGSTFFEGTTRARENAEMVHLLVFDFDNCIEVPIPGEFHASGRPKTHKIPIENPADPEAVVDLLQVQGYAAVVYTTWSSSPALVKFRVVLPLASPIAPGFWTEATEWAMDTLSFGTYRDSKAIDIPVLRDTARLNFLPCALDPSTVRVWELKGKTLAIPQAALPTYQMREERPPEWQRPRPAKDNRTGRDWWRDYRIDFKTLNLGDLLNSMGVKVGKAQPWHGGWKWRCHCPWASEHTHQIDDDCAVVIQTPGDWPAFKCAHSSHGLIGIREICEAAGKPLVESKGNPYKPGDEIHEEERDELQDDSGLPTEAEGSEDHRSTWDRLHKTKDGKLLRVPANLAKILRFDPQWGPRLALDEMSRDLLHDWAPQREHFIDQVQEWVQDVYGLNFGRDEVRAKLLAQCSTNTVHPVRQYLKSLPAWDGVERIAKLPGMVLRAADDPLTAQYLLRWFVAAVRRVLRPGLKVDTALVLVGLQGYLKSTFFSTLADPWFSDSPIDLANKDGFMVMHRSWIIELGEIDYLTSFQSQEKIKAFLSSRQDIFRPPYASSVSVFPRSCILVGSTNREGFLADDTGSRRFWPVKVGGRIDVDTLGKHRDQLWAEAVDLERSGLEHWLDQAADSLRENQSDEFSAEDPWEDLVRTASETHVRSGNYLSDGISIADIMRLMGLPVGQQNKSASMKLAGLLKRMGWEQFQFGPQRLKRWRPRD